MSLANAVFADCAETSTQSVVDDIQIVHTTRSVVVVEDNPDIRKLICMTLAPVEAEVVALSDGHQFSQFIEESAPPSVVVLDRMLPGLSGDLLLEKIRANDDWKNVPVVMISALRRKYDVQQLLKSGANLYLPKPLDFRTLLDVVGQCVDE